MSEIQVGKRKVGSDHPVMVVAEMAWSHDGSAEKACDIVRGAAEAGCEAVNLHLTSLPDYMVRCYGGGKGRVSAGKEGESIFGYLDRINLSFEDYRGVIEEARRGGLMISLMCNDDASLEFARSQSPEILMVHSSCLSDVGFLRKVGGCGAAVFLGTGGTTLEEISRAVEAIRESGNERVVLLHGFQAYPTRLDNVHLNFMRTLADLFGLPVGYSDHTDAESELALVVPMLAPALGASVIEKHMTHDRSLRGEDWEAALDPVEMKRFMAHLREIEKVPGSGRLRPFSDQEINYRRVSKKRAVARNALAAGTELTAEMICFKRSDDGALPEELGYLTGRRLKKALAEDDGIGLGELE